jgi:hypothetical protein
MFERPFSCGTRCVGQVWEFCNEQGFMLRPLAFVACVHQGVFFGKLSVSDPDAVPHKASMNPELGKKRRDMLSQPKLYAPYRPPSPPRTVI